MGGGGLSSVENRWIFCCVLIGLYAGCYSPERDLVADPYNTPLIHIIDAAYETAQGSVVIRWEYIGREPVRRFRISRKVSRGSGSPEEIGSVPGTAEGHTKTTVASFRDMDLVSGERVSYWVKADRGDRAETATERPVELEIPGAQMGGTLRNPFGGAVQVFWAVAPGGAVAYEVLRRAGEGTEEVVFRTENGIETSFWDRSLRGNLIYTYTIRTSMLSGVRLKSAEVQTGLYTLSSRGEIETLTDPEARIRLSYGLPFSDATLLALVVQNGQASVAQIEYKTDLSFDGSVTVFRRSFSTTPLDIGPLTPASVALAGPSVLGQAVPRLFVGGIHPESGQVVLKAYGLPDVDTVWAGVEDWRAAVPNSQVAMSADPEGRLFVAVDGELRVYSAQQVQVGTVSLNFGGPSDLLAGDETVWMVTSDGGRLLRGAVQSSGGIVLDILWQEVALPEGARPVALTQNRRGQVFVLDAGNRQVLALDAAGNRVLEWFLPEGDFLKGDLTSDASGGDLIHVSDTAGEVYTFLP